MWPMVQMVSDQHEKRLQKGNAEEETEEVSVQALFSFYKSLANSQWVIPFNWRNKFLSILFFRTCIEMTIVLAWPP